MRTFKTFIITLICTFSIKAYSELDLRRCMLLPITDSVGGGISFKVFEEVEKYIKTSDWCYYKSNSEILNILGNYKKNLNTYLKNKNVVKVVAEKVQAGSVIRIDLKTELKTTRVDLEVIGKNGSDLYFKETTALNSNDPYVIARTISNWLDVYEKSIPYDAVITGVLGHQFTIDSGRNIGMSVGDELIIVRPKRKKKHPLLKEIVDWETEKIGGGKTINVNVSQSQGKIEQYDSKKKIQLGDWVLVRKIKKINADQDYKIGKDDDKYKFGKLGEIGFYPLIGSGSESLTTNNSNLEKIGGLMYGAAIQGELWATRKYWVGLDIYKQFGSYKTKEGSFSVEKFSLSRDVLKIKAGYRFLPLGFFYGPRVDGYIGYASYGYGIDSVATDGVTDSSFKGLLLGAKGSMPIINRLRLFLRLDFMLGSTYKEEVAIYGEDDSSPNFNLEFGGEYQYAPGIDFISSIEFTSNKAKFESPTRAAAFKNTDLKIGVKYTY